MSELTTQKLGVYWAENEIYRKKEKTTKVFRCWRVLLTVIPLRGPGLEKLVGGKWSRK